jgi:hypothetical protein
MEKGKRKGVSLLARPGGGISARPGRARAGGPAGPWKGGTARANIVGVGPRVRGRRGGG